MHGDDNWIATYTARQFWPLDPRPEDVCIQDIAHSLALKCRFNGHCTGFYSVGQHCVLGSYLVSDKNALWFLLHDAPEAYLFDACRPVKNDLPFIRELEDRLMRCICDRFDLPYETPTEVKQMDDILLVTEIRDIMHRQSEHWPNYQADPLPERISCWTWQEAKSHFLSRFKALTS